MSKYAYLRADGRYDLYDVEPKTVTAQEYAALKKREELQARFEQLLVSRNKLDVEIADVKKQLAALPTLSAESVETPSTTAAIPNTATAEAAAKRKW